MEAEACLIPVDKALTTATEETLTAPFSMDTGLTVEEGLMTDSKDESLASAGESAPRSSFPMSSFAGLVIGSFIRALVSTARTSVEDLRTVLVATMAATPALLVAVGEFFASMAVTSTLAGGLVATDLLALAVDALVDAIREVDRLLEFRVTGILPLLFDRDTSAELEWRRWIIMQCKRESC